MAPQMNRPSETNAPPADRAHSSSSKAWIAAIVVVVFLIILAFVAYYAYRVWQARRQGLPPPPLNPFARGSTVSTRNYPARGGIVGWATSQWRSLRNTRTAGGAYESSGPGRRRTAQLDPDEAWDSRVGDEAYEEQELGLRHGRGDSDVGPYSGDGYAGAPGYARTGRGYGPSGGLQDISGRGRSRSRSELDERYEAETGRSTRDPFGDHAATDIRGVSPRPLDTGYGRTQGHAMQPSVDDISPTERRSIFKEDV